jgi:hypothetical protein
MRFWIYGIICMSALYIDLLIGLGSIPILTTSLCAIVILYELLAPYIRKK